MCTNREALVGFIYGELGPAEQHAFEQHLTECAECRAEVVGLQATRGQLASWMPPDADLGFRIVRGAAAPPVRRFFAPAWGLAAAAVLVLAAAAAIANIEVKRGPDGFTVRTGWGRADTRLVSAPAGITPTQLAALDQRLSEVEAAESKRQAAAPAAAASTPRSSDAEIFRRMRLMIGDAQTEQQQRFATVLAQVVRDMDRQRQVDLAAIQRGLGQYQALTNAEIAQQRDFTNQLMQLQRVSTGKEK